MPEIDPKCKKGHPPYVGADGTVSPCCWIATNPHAMKSFLGDLYDQLNLNVHGFEDVLSSKAMAAIESSWDLGTFEQCVIYCGKFPISESVTSVDNEITINLGRK